MAVEDRWTPEGERLMKELRELSKLEVGIGFQRGMAAEDNGTDITDIAMWNELGTVDIPSRPFMRDSVDKHIPAINHMLKSQEEALLSGEPARKVLETIGIFQKDLMQTEIEQGSFTPNAESTIRRKGSDKQLIDTGQMKNSVNFWIQEKGSGR